MKILTQVDKYFWILLILGISLGLFIPHIFFPLEGLVIYIVMAIAFLLFLKVNTIEIISNIKQPFFILYIAFINLIFTPILTYFVFKPFAPELIPALLLLAALPAGVSSVAFTDIMKGKTSLTLTVLLITNFLSILTIPALFLILNNTSLEINSLELGLNILRVLGIPYVLATLAKILLPKKAALALDGYYNVAIIGLLTLMITISMSFQADYILHNFSALIKPLFVLLAAFIFFQLIGYFSVFWQNKETKIAVSNTNMITNAILGIVLALGHFPQEVCSIIILALIPWNIMIIAKNWYKKLLP